MTQLPRSEMPDTARRPIGALPIFATGLGLFGGLLCTAVVLSQPLGAALDHLSRSTEKDAGLAQAFGVKPGADAGTRAVKVLAGINGVTASQGTERALAAEIISDPSPNIAPAAWDRLSNGGCMTVTTKAGASFSFRILGVRPAPAPAKPGQETPKVDLAITACPEAGESIVKAVIEPYAAPAKAVLPERSL